jgi:hypothetical protein
MISKKALIITGIITWLFLPWPITVFGIQMSCTYPFKEILSIGVLILGAIFTILYTVMLLKAVSKSKRIGIRVCTGVNVITGLVYFGSLAYVYLLNR